MSSVRIKCEGLDIGLSLRTLLQHREPSAALTDLITRLTSDGRELTPLQLDTLTEVITHIFTSDDYRFNAP